MVKFAVQAGKGLEGWCTGEVSIEDRGEDHRYDRRLLLLDAFRLMLFLTENLPQQVGMALTSFLHAFSKMHAEHAVAFNLAAHRAVQMLEDGASVEEVLCYLSSLSESAGEALGNMPVVGHA